MTEFPYISGVDVGTISNKEFARFETTKASDIVIALDKSGIPFSARFGDSEIVLTYDGSYKEQVEDIIAKANSGDYEALLLVAAVIGKRSRILSQRQIREIMKLCSVSCKCTVSLTAIIGFWERLPRC